MRPVHKNNVKYLSGVSNWRAGHNSSLLSVQKTDLVEKKRILNYAEVTSVYYHKSKAPVNGFWCRVMCTQTANKQHCRRWQWKRISGYASSKSYLHIIRINVHEYEEWGLAYIITSILSVALHYGARNECRTPSVYPSVRPSIPCLRFSQTRKSSCRWQTRATRKHGKWLQFDVKTSCRQVNDLFEVMQQLSAPPAPK